jgi:hypothetical protein
MNTVKLNFDFFVVVGALWPLRRVVYAFSYVSRDAERIHIEATISLKKIKYVVFFHSFWCPTMAIIQKRHVVARG